MGTPVFKIAETERYFMGALQWPVNWPEPIEVINCEFVAGYI
jgi:hypothetical protein